MKVIISENMAKRLLFEEAAKSITVDDVLKSREFSEKVRDILKNDNNFTKENEKLIKKLVSKCVNQLFLTLWQKNSFWKDCIENA